MGRPPRQVNQGPAAAAPAAPTDRARTIKAAASPLRGMAVCSVATPSPPTRADAAIDHVPPLPRPHQPRSHARAARSPVRPTLHRDVRPPPRAALPSALRRGVRGCPDRRALLRLYAADMVAPRTTLAGRHSTVVTLVAAALVFAAAAATAAALVVPRETPTAALAAPAVCDVTTCAAAGAAGLCAVGSAPTTCGAWIAARPSECEFVCTQECEDVLLCDSAGVGHCNVCMLQLDSCLSGFVVTGPISGALCWM